MNKNKFKKNFMVNFIGEALDLDIRMIYDDLELILESNFLPKDFILDAISKSKENTSYIIVRLNKYNSKKDEIIPIYYWKYKLNNINKYDSDKITPLIILELNNFDIEKVISKRKIVDNK